MNTNRLSAQATVVLRRFFKYLVEGLMVLYCCLCFPKKENEP